MKYGTMTYLNCDEGILMVRKRERENDPNSQYCTLPGGKLKDKEKGLKKEEGRLESAIRETREETGIKLTDLTLRGVILFDNQGRTFSNWPNPDNFYVYIYTAKTMIEVVN